MGAKGENVLKLVIVNDLYMPYHRVSTYCFVLVEQTERGLRSFRPNCALFRG